MSCYPNQAAYAPVAYAPVGAAAAAAAAAPARAPIQSMRSVPPQDVARVFGDTSTCGVSDTYYVPKQTITKVSQPVVISSFCRSTQMIPVQAPVNYQEVKMAPQAQQLNSPCPPKQVCAPVQAPCAPAAPCGPAMADCGSGGGACTSGPFQSGIAGWNQAGPYGAAAGAAYGGAMAWGASGLPNYRPYLAPAAAMSPFQSAALSYASGGCC